MKNNYFLAIALILAPLAAKADWQCSAFCDFYSNFVDSRDSKFIEKLAVDIAPEGTNYKEIAKYRHEVQMSGQTQYMAYRALTYSCFDTAAANSGSLFEFTPYSPKLINKDSLKPAKADDVCSE